MNEEKSRIFRPSFNERELKVVCKALHNYKEYMEEKRKTEGLTMGDLHTVASLMANLLSLLHGKVVGRRKLLGDFPNALTDDALAFYKKIDYKWLEELE